MRNGGNGREKAMEDNFMITQTGSKKRNGGKEVEGFLEGRQCKVRREQRNGESKVIKVVRNGGCRATPPIKMILLRWKCRGFWESLNSSRPLLYGKE